VISDIVNVLADVADERTRQDDRWGEQNHPDGTGAPEFGELADRAKQQYEDAARDGSVTWTNVLLEEVAEAFAESDPARLREELIQVAAVAVAWAECIDRREAKK
jgi:hypothetical protein